MKYIILIMFFFPLGIIAQTIERAAFHQGYHNQTNSGESIQGSFGGLVNVDHSSTGESIEKGFVVGETFIEQLWIIPANEWRTYSLFLHPIYTDMESLFIGQGIIEVRTQMGLVFNNTVPSFLNTLNTYTLTEGVWVYSDTPNYLRFIGEPIYSSVNPLPVTNSIQLIPVWTQENITPELLVNNNSGIVKIIDSVGNIYNPNLPSFLNTLNTLEPGKAYFLESSSNSFITF